MDGSEVLAVDGWLDPYRGTLINRWNHFKHKLWMIEHENGGIMNFSDRSRYGVFVECNGSRYALTQFDRVPRSGSQPVLVYREWVGNARSVSLCGDFNNWDTNQYKSTSQEFGVHTIHIPFVYNGSTYECPIKDG